VFPSTCGIFILYWEFRWNPCSASICAAIQASPTVNRKKQELLGRDLYDPFLNVNSGMSRHALLPQSAHFLLLTAEEPVIPTSGVDNCTSGHIWSDESHFVFISSHNAPGKANYIIFFLKLQKFLT